MSVRVRFAPSPTGYLHIGSARTALFNWLYARHHKGTMILRVEDTDKVRSKNEFLDEIMRSLKWLGLHWDEGPIFQSRRFDRYREIAQGLLKAGAAYEEKGAIIFRVIAGETLRFNDLVHGEIAFESQTLKDQVLMKGDGAPAYNFACVVDDSDMEISHVIRGDDHISNTPKQLILYRALKWEPPAFAHIPLILGEDRSRMSKRHGATAIDEYRKAGYLPEALVNFISLLGWSPGGDREMLSIQEIVDAFDLGRAGHTGAAFNVEKLNWMNGEYLKNIPAEILIGLWMPLLTERGDLPEGVTAAKLEPILKLFHGRVSQLDDFVMQACG
ncbi:MAG: glutamate--tRNA ligase, partial [Candidatus Omnitrophica bacterium]|nr:glutamate--tRNA ligase [Candidatus Omnitrophota bacterium]